MSKQTYGSLSGLFMLGLLGLVSGRLYGLDRFPVSSDPTQKAHSDYAQRIRTSKGLRHLFAFGGHLSPTFLSLSCEIRKHDLELAIRYDAYSPQAHGQVRLLRAAGKTHMASVIFVPLRSTPHQLGSIAHELYHMLTLFQTGKEGLSVAEESRAKEVATRIEKEAVSQYHKDRRRKPPGGVLVRTQPATEASSLSC